MIDQEHPTVGALLRARRLELGVSLEDVAGRTRVRRTYLAALEEDRFDLLPGDIYIAGFLRLYAEDLGLPVAPLLARCREQNARTGKETAVPAAVRPRSSRARRSGWSVALTAAALVMAAVLLAHFNLGETKQADFFAPRPLPGGFPAVLWGVLMPEPETGPLPPWPPSPPPEDVPPTAEEAGTLVTGRPGLDDGKAAPSSPAVVEEGDTTVLRGRPREADRRPVGVFLGWSATSPKAPPAPVAGPDLLVLNREEPSGEEEEARAKAGGEKSP